MLNLFQRFICLRGFSRFPNAVKPFSSMIVQSVFFFLTFYIPCSPGAEGWPQPCPKWRNFSTKVGREAKRCHNRWRTSVAKNKIKSHPHQKNKAWNTKATFILFVQVTRIEHRGWFLSSLLPVPIRDLQMGLDAESQKLFTAPCLSSHPDLWIWNSSVSFISQEAAATLQVHHSLNEVVRFSSLQVWQVQITSLSWEPWCNIRMCCKLQGCYLSL